MAFVESVLDLFEKKVGWAAYHKGFEIVKYSDKIDVSRHEGYLWAVPTLDEYNYS